jgi:hypothetical protein
VFAAGNPASTARLSTLSQLEYLRDVVYPAQIKSYSRRAQLLREFSEKSPEKASMVAPLLWDLENRLKAIRGYQAGLLDKDLMAKKAGGTKAPQNVSASATEELSMEIPGKIVTIAQQRKFDSGGALPGERRVERPLASYANAGSCSSAGDQAKRRASPGISWCLVVYAERDLNNKSSIDKDLKLRWWIRWSNSWMSWDQRIPFTAKF